MSMNMWSDMPQDRSNLTSIVSAPPLLTLTYRSRATAPLSAAELGRLRDQAAARNHAEGISGIVLYDDDRFFQWIEGPPKAIRRVWASISEDQRHTEIEALSLHAASVRLFGQWDLKLATKRQELAAFLPVATEGFTREESRLLASLTLGTDPDAARALLRDAYARDGSLLNIKQELIEPAARHLGDVWGADDCDEFDLALGLCRLQSCLRDIVEVGTPKIVVQPLVVLVAPLPGEIHMLGATLDGDATWRGGWDTHVEFPSTDEALRKIVSSNWFDAVALSLSPALLREHRVEGMKQIISSVRKASRNPSLVVVAGGRAFFEKRVNSTDVGADADHMSCNDLVEAIEQARRDRE